MKFLRGLWRGWSEFWAMSWWGKGPVLAILAFLLISAIGSASGGDSSGDAASNGDGQWVEERAREIVAKTPKAEPTVLVTVGAAPSPVIVVPSPTVIIQEPEPVVPGSTFGDGIQVVGEDIEAGTYRTDGGESCYWERLSGFGGSFDEIIANDNPTGQVVVTISPSDAAFKSQRCGTWTRVSGP